MCSCPRKERGPDLGSRDPRDPWEGVRRVVYHGELACSCFPCLPSAMELALSPSTPGRGHWYLDDWICFGLDPRTSSGWWSGSAIMQEMSLMCLFLLAWTAAFPHSLGRTRRRQLLGPE